MISFDVLDLWHRNLPVGSIKLSEQSDAESQGHVFSKVHLCSTSNIKGIGGALLGIGGVSHVARFCVSIGFCKIVGFIHTS
jgi:hypothetical protein